MKGIILFLLVSFLAVNGITAQYKYDNTLFKTVYIDDLCEALRKNPEHLLLDVRTPGEYSDTSSSASLNIGHLKGATNLDINLLEKRWKELLPYKDKPIFVYCSHSQRSRRVSKFLTDSGFTKIHNVNGAMTEFNLLRTTEITCSKELYETNNKFTLLAPHDVAQLMRSEKNLFILDVRSDSAFRGISRTAAENAQGKLKGAVNIPFAQLPNSLDKLSANRQVLVVADYGHETNLAAKLLTDKGFTTVYAAFNGMNQWISEPAAELASRKDLWQQNLKTSLVTAEDMDAMIKKSPAVFFLDVRTRDEFQNKFEKEQWRNRGHIRNAVNIPVAELANRWNEIADQKNNEVIIYTFNTGNEAFESAAFLTSKGFSRVHILMGGLWNVRWKAANLKGLSHMMDYVVDVPAENQ